MKKLITFFLFFCCFTTVLAQNIQVHYDFGQVMYGDEYQERPQITTTIEMFKPDKWGSTFFFVDMDYTKNGIYGGYFEIGRDLRFWDAPFSAHIEYNGGLVRGASFRNNYLGGATYTYNNATFSKGFSLMALYKHIQYNDQPHNFQLTGTWYIHFGKNKQFTFNGFADFWKEKTPVGDFIFLSEPQFWVNFNKIKEFDEKFNLSMGTEVELSHNFAFHKGFYAIPTVGIKWTFD